jgi:hypothetical protein
MDMCPRDSVLCCPVSVEALHRADPPAKESYQISLYMYIEKPVRVGQMSAKDCAFFFLKKIITSVDFNYVKFTTFRTVAIFLICKI